MKHYVVTGLCVTVLVGLVLLLPDQAAARAHALRLVSGPGAKRKAGKKGEEAAPEPSVYEVLQATQFKRGETFGYDGPLPKALADCLTDAAEAAAAAEAAQREREREHAAAFHAGLRAGLITAAMNGCTKLGAVTADGKPDPAVLSQLAGFSPSVEEMQQALAASEPQG